MVDSLSAAVIGVFCADAIVCSVLFIAFFRRRYRQPVKPRQPLIVLFYTAGLQLVGQLAVVWPIRTLTYASRSLITFTCNPYRRHAHCRSCSPRF